MSLNLSISFTNHSTPLHTMQTLKFSRSNGKLKGRLIFSLPAGYSCPHAGVCKTFADRETGAITDLPQMTGVTAEHEFRCFAAMSEVRPNVRNARWHNWNLLKEVLNTSRASDQVENVATLIDTSLTLMPPNNLVRIHESGDFWTENYMKAWIEVARQRPYQKFYAYTKSLGMWLSLQDEIPDNFFLTASHGGTLDYLIGAHPNVFKRVSHVVYTEEQAQQLGLEIDHDDSHCLGEKPFALLVHGSQRAGSEASQAIAKRKKENGFVGYGTSSKKS